jgi:protein involved in polysaccharide export with SLBB domain
MKQIIEAVRRLWKKRRFVNLAINRAFAIAVLIGSFIPASTNAQQPATGQSPGRVLPPGYVNPESTAQRLFSSEGTQTTASGQSTIGTLAATGLPQNELALEAATKNYTLTENDVISVKVYQEQDLDAILRVAKDGTVNYWLLGRVRVGGQTVQDATRMIRESLAKDYLVNPQVNVTIVEYARREFTILGEVQRAGSYVIPEGKPLTLQQAIALAGGFKPSAKKGKVIVTRWAGGQKQTYRVSADALARERESKPFFILPDDHVQVDESFF